MPGNGSVLSSSRYVPHVARCERSELWHLNKQQVQAACSFERSFVNRDLLPFFMGACVRFERFVELEEFFPRKRKPNLASFPTFHIVEQKNCWEI